MRLSGIHNFQDYFPLVEDEALAKMDQQANQASQQKQQADQAMMQAQMDQMKAMSDMVKVEAQKTQMKYQSDMAAMQQKHQADLEKLQAQLADMAAKHTLEMTKVYLQDDRERDKMDMDFAIKTKEVLLSSQEVASTEAKVNAPRNQDQIQ